MNNKLPKKIAKITEEFKGSGLEVESAIGCYYMCLAYGWRVMKIIHGRRKWKRYMEIMEIDFETKTPEETELSEKNLGFKLWKATGKYYNIMEGRIAPKKGRKSDLI